MTPVKFYKSAILGAAKAYSKNHVGVVCCDLSSQEIWLDGKLISNVDSRVDDLIAKIESLPQDMFVKSGSVVTEDAEGNKGMFIKLVLSNDDEVYIPSNALVDTYVGDDEYIEVENYTIKFKGAETISTLETKVASLETGKLEGLVEGNGIKIDSSNTLTPTVEVKVAENSAIGFTEDKALDLFWSE